MISDSNGHIEKGNSRHPDNDKRKKTATKEAATAKSHSAENKAHLFIPLFEKRQRGNQPLENDLQKFKMWKKIMQLVNLRKIIGWCVS